MERGADRCVPRYYNGVGSGGWLSPGGSGGYRGDSRNCTPSSRYAADVQQGLSLTHVVACESWDQSLVCMPSHNCDVGQWPGNITHGHISSGWNHSDLPNRITHAEVSRNAPPRFSGSNCSGRATSTFGRIKNSV